MKFKRTLFHRSKNLAKHPNNLRQPQYRRFGLEGVTSHLLTLQHPLDTSRTSCAEEKNCIYDFFHSLLSVRSGDVLPVSPVIGRQMWSLCTNQLSPVASPESQKPRAQARLDCCVLSDDVWLRTKCHIPADEVDSSSQLRNSYGILFQSSISDHNKK